MSVRLRVALAFALASGLVLVMLSLFLHARVRSDLDSSIDQELRARADLLRAALMTDTPVPIAARQDLIDPDEAFAQVLDAHGAILQSSSGVASAPVLPASTVAKLAGPTFAVRRVAGVDDRVRLLAVPLDLRGEPVAVVVGATLGDRNEALHRLLLALSLGVPVALLLSTYAGWLVAGLALRPVERLRREAAAITASGLDHRLDVPATRDEIARLATTLNDLLARLEEAVQRERRFVDEASHELRTPLAVLKGEVELALSRPRSTEELTATLRAVASETDEVVRLAEDLLVLARASGGRVPVRRQEVELVSLLRGLPDVAIEASGSANLDPVRVRQAVLDLVDNARRHGRVSATATRDGKDAVLVVSDDGPGFAADLLERAFEPFVHGDSGGSGLGLALVKAVAEAHGGSVTAENPLGGGACVTLRLPS
jgi:two-component system OmpR family sensor kinase